MTAETVTVQPATAPGEAVRRITLAAVLHDESVPDQLVLTGLLHGASLALAGPEWFMGAFAGTGAPLSLLEQHIASARKFMDEFPIVSPPVPTQETTST